jgi:uncharacterized protein (TIGR03437 family)
MSQCWASAAIALVFAFLPAGNIALTPTTITLASSANPATLGQAVTLTVTVSPATASGLVTFYDGAGIIGIVGLSGTGSQATLITKALPSGSRSLRAFYAGNPFFAANSSATLAQTVFALPQNGFRSVLAYSAGTNAALAVAVEDFNRDGIPDLATLTSGGAVVVQLGKGDGTFQPAVSYNVGPPGLPTEGGLLVVADFNGDGRLDLALSAVAGVSVLLGNGDGTFQAAVNVAPLSGPLAVGDFNGDGRADIVIAGSTVSVLLGNGDGTFQPAINSRGVTAFNVVVADFNGDGLADIALGINSGIAVLLGNGDGTFHLPIEWGSLKGGESVVAADFNGDGKADLALSGPNFGNLAVLLGNGDGTFQPQITYNAPLSLWVGPIMTGDFNGDGTVDIAVAGYTAMSVLLGNGNGTFQAPVSYTLTPSSDCTELTSVAVADFNGDGVSDLVAALGYGFFSSCDNGNVDLLLGVPTAAAPRPVVNNNGIVAAANYQAATPGAIASLFGSNLSQATAAAMSVPIPTELSGVSVSANGILAPLFYVSAAQINFQVPWEMLGQTQANIVVTVNGSSSTAQTVGLYGPNPGIFTLNASGAGQGAIQIANTAIFAAPAHPAMRGEYLTIDCSGLGDVSPRPATGAPAPISPLSNTLVSPYVTIGGVIAPLSFSGLAPGFVGLYQVNVQVPNAAPSGGQVPVGISIGGVSSNVVTIAVQ